MQYAHGSFAYSETQIQFL
ncbi:hypothetical protein PMI42_05341 [Bradyrhizobium sp. YR681]|nr:hypothetical protein PMI42_05341 [Bradyrhizobium sp. YR681]